MKRILVIEDDFAIRNSVEFALRREGFEVRSLDSGERALEAVRAFDPDLVLLDIMLPGKNGHEICREVCSLEQDVAIIMVSALGEEHDRITGLRLGADDYICKPFSLDELLARVHANLRKSERGGSGSQRKAHANKRLIFGVEAGEGECAHSGNGGSLLIDPATREVVLAGSKVTLRAKEFDLLYALASRPGEVLTREVLSEEVWGQDYLASSRTIDVHVRRLRALFAQHGAPEYVRTVHGVGYRFVAEAG